MSGELGEERSQRLKSLCENLSMWSEGKLSTTHKRKDISPHILQGFRKGFLTFLPHSVDDLLLLCIGESGVGLQLFQGLGERLAITNRKSKLTSNTLSFI